jgi:hypothetical protein
MPATLSRCIVCAGIGISLLITLWSALASAQTRAPDQRLPSPQTMSPCPAGDHFSAAIERTASSLGDYLGCFVSPHTASWKGTRSISVPLDHAYAVELRSGPYTSADLDQMLSLTREQWKTFTALSEEQRAAQERRMSDLVSSLNNPNVAVTERDPVLVSIAPTGKNAYTVIAIRPRRSRRRHPPASTEETPTILPV